MAVTAMVVGSMAVSAYSAYSQASAASDAAEMQNNAANAAARKDEAARQQALALQKQQYEQAQRNMAPYVNMGQQANTALGRMMGLGGLASPYGASPYGPPQQPPQAPTRPGAAPRYGAPYRAASPDGQAFRPIPYTPDTAQPLGPPQPRQMVQLRAPTGEIESVPAEHQDFYLGRGATLVGGVQ